ncbi:NADH:ubiquinone oxidoreductase subunit E [Deinobacterium chartae]|uniref:NADH:ubiquinone oxidoreductase subunit E n=1 Tax=Deinobacterium chartae TaxID=521158 RepID=A0A841I205_9DEIO|nr:NAD(P)H-dependent oxidoreductase subunit E [Deinobacterium chartae]MBB6098450.1 NADH:ubiquinone oxidoreductase subunit E [Deinobacterium chartae]
MTLIELCTDGLDPATREEILDIIYSELRISPGGVSADGDFELQLRKCGEDLEGAPYLRINGALFARVTPQRARELVRARKR